jgi:glycerol kinase
MGKAMGRAILAIDQGTTSSRALVFDAARRVVGLAQQELTQHYPADGWVEHDAEEIWRDCLAAARAALAQSGLAPADLAAIGIANQRETVVLWERASGRPIAPAIVWQDRRTAARCAELRKQGHEPLVQARTGLLLDPYFSATKLAWLLDNIAGARERAENGELAFGTIDSFLLWRLTEGRSHRTDITNASRTLLFDIHRQRWCPDLLALFGVPEALLPEVCDNAGAFGHTTLLGGKIAICGMAGDQQAALVGQSCLAAGQAKITYGTGGFLLLNTGTAAIASHHRLLTTVASRYDGVTRYALEGSLFVAGAAIKWLRDGLGLIADSRETEALAASLPDNGGVYLVPAFVGLGAPHWDAGARGLITGLTLDSGRAHVVRAALEAVAFQTNDLIAAMRGDGAAALAALRVDGGMAANDWFCQFLADLIGIPVERPDHLEATALGAALLAAHASGAWPGALAGGGSSAALARFVPRLGAAPRERLLGEWQAALRRARTG